MGKPFSIPPDLFDPAPASDENERDIGNRLLCGFLGPESKSGVRLKTTIPPKRWARCMREVDEMMNSGDWSDASPAVFVALYALLHERVYDVEPAELTPKERLHAAGAAARLLLHTFGGDKSKLAEFMRWTWMREAKTEKWRRDNIQPGRRIGWRLQFGQALVTDWRLDSSRRHSK